LFSQWRSTPLLDLFCLQRGKEAIDLIIDFLTCLWDYAKQQITREIGAVADLSKLTETSVERLSRYSCGPQTLLMSG
jgi:hypothetical protein